MAAHRRRVQEDAAALVRRQHCKKIKLVTMLVTNEWLVSWVRARLRGSCVRSRHDAKTKGVALPNDLRTPAQKATISKTLKKNEECLARAADAYISVRLKLLGMQTLFSCRLVNHHELLKIFNKMPSIQEPCPTLRVPEQCGLQDLGD